MSFVKDLDKPILQVSPRDAYSLRDLARNVAVFGGIGSGKTSGSGKLLASACLRAGMGALVLCAKPDEVDLWLRYCKENGRSKDVILFGDDGKGGWTGSLNFIEYELRRQGQRGLGSVIECIMQLFEADRLVKPGASKSGDAFWDNTSRQILRNCVPTLFAAYGTVRLEEVMKFVNTAPRSPEDLKDGKWCTSSFMFQTMKAARNAPKHPIDTQELSMIFDYWGMQFAEMDRKLRSNIVSNLSTTIDRFLRGRLRDHFCRDTTITPDMCFDGKIIIMSMPALTWNEDGIIAQQLVKYLWQRVVLARNAMPQAKRDRFVLCWADEAQYFMNRSDGLFLSSSRSARACTVYLTQSFATYIAVMGDGARSETDRLVGNFGTYIWHANSEYVTNEWASKAIGRSLQGRRSYSKGTGSSRNRNISRNEGTAASSNFSEVKPTGNSWGSFTNANSHSANTSTGNSTGDSTSSNESESVQEVMDFEIEPAFFARELATGGPAGAVESVWFYANGRFKESDRNYLFVECKQ